MNSITKRWIKGSLLITIIVLIIAQAVMAVFVRNSYYSAAHTAILSRINSISGTLSSSSKLSNVEKSQLLYRLSEDFSEKDKFAIMLLGAHGNILATSTGFYPSDNFHLQDISNSMQVEDGISTNTYRTTMGEKVLSATMIVYPAADNVYAVRLVTSLEKIDSEINLILAFTMLACIAMVGFSILSGLYFVKSIVRPIQDIEKTATKISKGEFDARITNVYNDEIGSLCNTINNMAHELGRSDEIKNDFISSVSHELRTPLTAIKGWAETIDKTNDTQTINKGTGIILSETERLYTMVENLLDFSRLQQASINLQKEKLDIVAEVGEAVLMFAPRCNMNNIELKFNEPEDIIPVFADKDRLKQVFVNLLDNAIKYSKPNSRIDVNISNSILQKRVTVEIKDYGQGIHPEDIDKITQKFYKGKSAKRGSGIGLALVSEIVEAHGGTLNIKSEQGKYTSMQVTLNVIRTMRGK